MVFFHGLHHLQCKTYSSDVKHPVFLQYILDNIFFPSS